MEPECTDDMAMLRGLRGDVMVIAGDSDGNSDATEAESCNGLLVGVMARDSKSSPGAPKREEGPLVKKNSL